MSMEVNDDFLDMLESLQDYEVDVLVVGAYTMATRGFPRATGDFDLTARLMAENAKRIYDAHRQIL